MQKVLQAILFAVLISSAQTLPPPIQTYFTDGYVTTKTKLDKRNINFKSGNLSVQTKYLNENGKSSKKNNFTAQIINGKGVLSFQSRLDSFRENNSEASKLNHSYTNFTSDINREKGLYQSQQNSSHSQTYRDRNNKSFSQSAVFSFDPNGHSKLQYNTDQYQRNQRSLNKSGQQKNRKKTDDNGNAINASQRQYNNSAIQITQNRNRTYYQLSKYKQQPITWRYISINSKKKYLSGILPTSNSSSPSQAYKTAPQPYSQIYQQTSVNIQNGSLKNTNKTGPPPNSQVYQQITVKQNGSQNSQPFVNSSVNTMKAGTPLSQITILCSNFQQCKTDYYNPVCATMRDGSIKYVKNDCLACNGGAESIKSYTAGLCK